MISLQAIFILRLMISIIICDAFFSLKGKKPQGVGVDSNPPGPYRLIYLYLSKRNNDFTKSDFYSKTHDFYHNLRIIFFFSHFPQQLVYLELKLLPVKLLFLRYHFMYHFRIISYILTFFFNEISQKNLEFYEEKCQPFGLFLYPPTTLDSSWFQGAAGLYHQHGCTPHRDRGDCFQEQGLVNNNKDILSTNTARYRKKKRERDMVRTGTN